MFTLFGRRAKKRFGTAGRVGRSLDRALERAVHPLHLAGSPRRLVRVRLVSRRRAAAARRRLPRPSDRREDVAGGRRGMSRHFGTR
jgi:hypothetical protein